MAYALTTYEQTGVYDPTNPNQRTRELYAADPGRWASYYFNKVPTTAGMQGLRGMRGLGDINAGWATLSSPIQLAIIAAVGGAIGFFGWSKFGDKLKPTIKKVPIVGGMLSGPRRRRR